MLGPGAQCTPCIASVPVLSAHPLGLNILVLDRYSTKNYHTAISELQSRAKTQNCQAKENIVPLDRSPTSEYKWYGAMRLFMAHWLSG